MKLVLLDMFDTTVSVNSLDFYDGLKGIWEKYFKDICTYDEMREFGMELYPEILATKKEYEEVSFAKDEFPRFCEHFGLDHGPLSQEDETEFRLGMSDVTFLDETRDLLECLKEKGIPVCILSNACTSAISLRGLLKSVGADEYFERVFSSSDFGLKKPATEYFDYAVTEMAKKYPGLTKDDIVYIGDDYVLDATGGSRAGIKTFWLNRKGEENVDNLPIEIVSDMKAFKETIINDTNVK